MKTYCLSLLLLIIGLTESFGETSPRLNTPIADNFIHENACDTILIDQDGVPVRIIGSIDKVKGTRLRIKSCDGKITQFYDHEKVISLNGVPFSSWLANYFPESTCDTILIDQDGVPVRIIGLIDKIKSTSLRIKFCERTFIRSLDYENIISINSIPISTWIASMQPKSKRFVKVVLQDGTKYAGELLAETDKEISLRTYEGDSLRVQTANVESVSPQEFDLLIVRKKNQKIKRVIKNGEGTGFWLKENIKMKRGILQNINPASIDVGSNTFQLYQLEAFSPKRYKSDLRALLFILSGLLLAGAYIALLIIWFFTLLGVGPDDLRWTAIFGAMGLPLILIQFPLKFSFKKYDFIPAPKDQNWEKGDFHHPED